MDLPISVTSAVAATRCRDFIAQADVDRMARLARVAAHQRRGHVLARFAAAVAQKRLTARQASLPPTPIQ